MKIKYFTDTDTLYIEFQTAKIIETRDLDDNTLIDIDMHGNVCAITIEHAQQRADIPNIVNFGLAGDSGVEPFGHNGWRIPGNSYLNIRRDTRRSPGGGGPRQC